MDNILDSPEIKEALRDVDELNTKSRTWAKLDMFYTRNYRRVCVYIGRFGERWSHRIDYRLTKNGNVEKHYNSGL